MGSYVWWLGVKKWQVLSANKYYPNITILGIVLTQRERFSGLTQFTDDDIRGHVKTLTESYAVYTVGQNHPAQEFKLDQRSFQWL